MLESHGENVTGEKLFDECLKDDKILCEKLDVEIERQKTKMAGENARDAGLPATDEMKPVVKGALDHGLLNSRIWTGYNKFDVINMRPT